MKELMLSALLVIVSLTAKAATAEPPVEPPKTPEPATAATSVLTNAPPIAPPSTNGTITDTNLAAPVNPVVVAVTNAASTPVSTDTYANSAIALSAAKPPPRVKPMADGERSLRLNFRNAPLDSVLNYLSEAAGFIIIKEVDLSRDRIDVWSQQPLTKAEAIELLDTILYSKGYAAVQNERTLKIVSRDVANKENVQVIKGSDPETIPNADKIVTQILPVKYANATQMTRDLLPLLPTSATMTANESGNALVITARQSDIKRMAKIITALDTSISGIAGIRVFPLRFADAKDLAAVIKELFPPPSGGGGGGGRGGGGNNPAAMFMQRFGGGGGRGGGGGGDMGGGGGTGQSEARQAASRVTAVADERTNSLIVSAPTEIVPTIEQLVNEVDTNAENITELRVFHLTYADPVETADLLASLFPDDTSSSNNRTQMAFRGGGRGGIGGFLGMGGRGGGGADTSTRAKQKGKVLAVPDQRTASLVVSAASDLMPQIAEMISQLDANPAKKQGVNMFSIQNADADAVLQVLQDLFQSQNSRSGTTSRQTMNPLTQRQQNQNYGTSSGTSSGLGGGGAGGASRRTGQ